MLKLLTAPTEQSVVEAARTFLSADYIAADGGDLPVENTAGMFSDLTTYPVIGNVGTESAELVECDGGDADDGTLSVGKTYRDHKKGEPVTLYRFNQRKFYGALAKAGPYVELSGSPLAIAVDDPQGTTIEYDGPEGYSWFKSTYYDSENDSETDIDDATARSGSNTMRYAGLWSIRKRAGFEKNGTIGDDRVEAARKTAEGSIDAAIANKYRLPLSVVPEDVADAVRNHAAAILLFEEYGGENAEANALMNLATATKTAIADGTLTLLDADSASLPVADSGNASFAPNDLTYGSTTDPTGPKMPRNKVY